MNNNKNYQFMAKQFMDLWQQQMQAFLQDGEFVNTMLASLQQMANYGNISPNESAQSSANATHASDALGQRTAEFDYRLRMVEERLARIESARKPEKSAAKPTGSRRAGSKAKIRKTS